MKDLLRITGVFFTLLITFCEFGVINVEGQVQKNIPSKYYNFAHNIPANWNGEGLKSSDRHYKVGQYSVQWDWQRGAEVIIKKPEGLNASYAVKKKVSKSLYSENKAGETNDFHRVGGLMCWIYNENPVNDYLKVEFGNGQEKAYQFSYYLNYTGWRACWIRFSEMEQLAEADQLDYMKLIAPENSNSGTLYFDRMSFNGKAIHARSTPDQQLPFINPMVNYNHWGAQWYWETTFKHDIHLEYKVTQKQIDAFVLIEKRLLDIIKGDVPHQDENWYYKDNFNDLRIIRHKDGGVSGRPIVSADEYDPLLNDLKPLQLSPIFLGLARGYVLADDDQSKEMFFDLFDHFNDQGYDYGSGTGTQHHFGYQFERIPESFLLMKEALKETGRLEKASQVLAYWYGNAECRKNISVNDLQGVADLWNTKAKARLIAVLLMDDSPEKVREMKALSRFFSNTMQYSSGWVGGITPDGSLFHHSGLYPAYMTGSFMGISPVVYALSHTQFEIEDQARKNLAQSMLLMRNYSNKYDWPISLSGRQVFAGKICQRVIDGMGYVAKAGEGDQEINKDLAAAYMRLAQPGEKMYREFQEMDVQPEINLDGFQVVNYACLGLHRRDDWQVSVKGYSKYVWSGEIYEHDNRWGRYMSYGTIQINNSGQPINGKSSGWVQNGWDWNRFPGTTTIHLPLEKLYCPVKKLMARTDETFCGSSSLLGKNGIFGMKLHEALELNNFTPDHRARKSVFCFDDCIIALGSNIVNSNHDYPTETTLFQLESGIDSILEVDGQNYMSFFNSHLNKKQAHQLTDNKGNTYFIPKGQELMIARQKQKSKHNKSERDTEGIFAVACLNHGRAPKNAGYEYATVVNGKQSGKTPDYKVLQKNWKAHVVEDKSTGITGFVMFEAGNIDHTIVHSVSHESLIMLKKENDHMILSLCSPSVNLENTKAYAASASIPVDIELQLKGSWNLSDEFEGCIKTKQSHGKTQFRFTCVNGKPIEVKLLLSK